MNAIYHKILDLRQITIKVATECLKNIARTNLDIGFKEEDLPDVIESLMWKPEYLPYRKI